ncbi:hypothetical protein [Paenibacillus sp. MDMC362]|uniref:hypothetical protein n=1 Tax=Paenibacillus sp. MDMC362 TaxID=2977365 RepID=UPI000DC40A7A|nr:hypothetical protein [Paenibacillus sp. MDMC362]RAR41786.1 hypothetical protein DP091_21900 [Paenibacillus sp. MDMC362]
MRLVRKSVLTLCSLLLAVSVLFPQTTVHAADQKWMNQVWSEYKSYNKKTVNAYNNYQKQVDKEYKVFYDASHASLDQLEKKVLEDQKHWDEKLQADLDQLKLKYEGNRDLKDKLTQYERFINPSYLNGPMWKYAKAADRDYLNSTLWKLSKEMNEDYLNSPMWKLRNGSSTSYLNSPMWKYKQGKISKATAKSQYSKLFKEQTNAISKGNAARKSEITKMASGTQKKIGELYKETVITLETRREEALKSISDLRIEITGEGLQWEALLAQKP